MILYIMRHGETEWNTKHWLQGRTDIPINENGRKVAELTREGLKDVVFDAAFTSPLLRAKETAQIVLEGRDVELIEEQRIIEMCFGDYEGTSMVDKHEDMKIYFERPKEYIVKNNVHKVKDKYDFIIIDCPPSLSMLTINAMTTADSVLVPIQCEYYALEGLSQLIHTIDLVQQRLNPNLSIDGVVFTMYDARTNLSLQVVENVKDNLQQTIYKTIIPRNIRLAEAPSHGLPINLYDPKSSGAESYMLLAEEVINKGEE